MSEEFNIEELLEASDMEKKIADKIIKAFKGMSKDEQAKFMKAYVKNPDAAVGYMFSNMKKMAMKEEVGLDEASMDGMCCKNCGDEFGKPKSESCTYDAYNAEGKNWIKKESYNEEMDPVNKKAVKKKFADRKDKDIDNDGDVDSSDEYLHKRRKAISKALDEAKLVSPADIAKIAAKRLGNQKGKADRYDQIKVIKDILIAGGKKNVATDRDFIDDVLDILYKKHNFKEEVELDEVLDTPEKMDRYKAKAKSSRDRAASSATAINLRSKDKSQREHPAKDLKTMAKRTAGLRMADKAAMRKTFKALRKEEVELDEAKTDVYHQHMLKALGKTRLPKNHSYTSAIANNGDFVVKDGGGRVVGRIAKGEHNLK